MTASARLAHLYGHPSDSVNDSDAVLDRWRGDSPEAEVARRALNDLAAGDAAQQHRLSKED